MDKVASDGSSVLRGHVVTHHVSPKTANHAQTPFEGEPRGRDVLPEMLAVDDLDRGRCGIVIIEQPRVHADAARLAVP